MIVYCVWQTGPKLFTSPVGGASGEHLVVGRVGGGVVVVGWGGVGVGRVACGKLGVVGSVRGCYAGPRR